MRAAVYGRRPTHRRDRRAGPRCRVARRLTDSGAEVVLYTGGWSVTRATVERLAEACHRFVVSLDGPSAEVHDRIRGRAGSFDRALRTLELLDEVSRACPSTRRETTAVRYRLCRGAEQCRPARRVLTGIAWRSGRDVPLSHRRASWMRCPPAAEHTRHGAIRWCRVTASVAAAGLSAGTPGAAAAWAVPRGRRRWQR
ncbi:radical SAM protein [Streptomyces sp. NPDC020192]|uniref:radical SAM protein n=1 Tax=Streptomyces sp. NPDC020192 TaxID=3365066 RepID=UPI0037A0E8A5